MKKFSFYLSILAMLMVSVQLQSCKKDKDTDPQIQTSSVTALGPGKVLMKGNIVNKGSFNVTDYGFVYSTTTSAISETVGTKVSLGQNPDEGEYSKQVDNIVAPSGYSTLYVRAYLTNERGTAFGKLTTVSLPTPTASSVTPSSGKSGDQVTIAGQFYSSSASDVKVTFGGVQASVVSVSSTQIVVQVPSGISAVNNSSISVVVSVAGQTAVASTYFIIQANVKDYSPKSGPIGTVITFTGDNLPSYYSSDVSVSFGGVSQSINYYSVMQATVPSNVTSNSFAISATISGKTFAMPGTFSVVAPTITALSPSSGIAGTQVTVSGTNFPTSYGSYSATLGGTSISISPYSSNQFTFTVPTNMSPGSYALTLTAGPSTVTATDKFTVTTPSVSSFSPTSGLAGRQIIINGTFIAYQNYTVYFGSTSTTGYASSTGILSVNVPSGISAGDVKISVTVGGQTVSAPGLFTVTTPVITSFSPTTGVAGTVVTISGTGLSNGYYPNVTFGSINASVLSASDNSVRVVVPSNTGNGAMKITVNMNGQTAVSTSNFTVTN